MFDKDLEKQHSHIVEQMKADAMRAHKYELKIGNNLSELRKQAADLRKEIEDKWDILLELGMQSKAFNNLQEIEQGAAPKRIEQLEMEINRLQNSEASLQSQYAKLIQEREQIQERCQKLSTQIM